MMVHNMNTLAVDPVPFVNPPCSVSKSIVSCVISAMIASVFLNPPGTNVIGRRFSHSSVRAGLRTGVFMSVVHFSHLKVWIMPLVFSPCIDSGHISHSLSQRYELVSSWPTALLGLLL